MKLTILLILLIVTSCATNKGNLEQHLNIQKIKKQIKF